MSTLISSAAFLAHRISVTLFSFTNARSYSPENYKFARTCRGSLNGRKWIVSSFVSLIWKQNIPTPRCIRWESTVIHIFALDGRPLTKPSVNSLAAWYVDRGTVLFDGCETDDTIGGPVWAEVQQANQSSSIIAQRNPILAADSLLVTTWWNDTSWRTFRSNAIDNDAQNHHTAFVIAFNYQQSSY